jgi:hypothetical protein
VIKAGAEAAISFDNGPNGSIAEDIYFAARAIAHNYSFGWVEGEHVEGDARAIAVHAHGLDAAEASLVPGRLSCRSRPVAAACCSLLVRLLTVQLDVYALTANRCSSIGILRAAHVATARARL